MNKQTKCIIIIFVISLIVLLFILYYLKVSSNFNNTINNDIFHYEIDNFLTNEECDTIINNSINNLVDSKVLASDDQDASMTFKDSRRTSQQHSFDNNLIKNIITKTENLINKYSKNLVNRKHFENMQVLRYKTNGEYQAHMDICHPHTEDKTKIKTCKADYERFKSIRYATVIFYLNAGFNGGNTYFPNIDKKIIPKKGKALLFFNCKFNKNTNNTGLCDTINNSKHAGEPVLSGKINEKWIATIWVRTKEI